MRETTAPSQNGYLATVGYFQQTCKAIGGCFAGFSLFFSHNLPLVRFRACDAHASCGATAKLLTCIRPKNRFSRYNRSPLLAALVASIEMPKGIMRRVPDVALGVGVRGMDAMHSHQAADFLDRLRRRIALGEPGTPEVHGSTMVNFPGRNDRRRRVLKEDVLSASNSRGSHRADVSAESPNNAPRYSDAAGVENHPQVTDFVPRRYGTIVMLVFIGAGLTALTAALHYCLLPIAISSGLRSAWTIDLGAPGNLASWLAAVVLFLACGFCLLTYSIRRHRIDDFRGRYRVWLAAALACLVLSANSVSGLHEVLTDVLGRVTGWSALRNGAAWWLMLAGLPLAWIFVRVLLDIRECRVGAALLVGSAISYAISAISFFGFGPTVEPAVQPILIAAPLLLGHWLAFAAIVTYTRFVVLDAQGLVAVRRRAPAKRAASRSPAKHTSAQSSPPSTTARPTLTAVEVAQTLQAAKRPSDSSQWVDGSRAERERYDDDADDDSEDGDRKLSKSERKRLRKMKTQGRAA
jgi:hypothetical protein